MNTSIEPISKKQKQLRCRARQLAFRYMSNTMYSCRKFMEPCLIPFINRNYIQQLWSSPSVLLVLDSGRLVNLLLPEDYDSDSVSQAGMTLGLAIGMLKLAKPSNIRLKVNVMCRLTLDQHIRLARFLKETPWIEEIQLNVPSIPNPSIQMLVNMIASKITFYSGPNCYIPYLANQPKLQTLMNTQEMRPYDWLTKRPNQHQPDYSILSAFRTGAKSLRFEVVGLFENVWKNDPLPENLTVQSIRFTDPGLMNKTNNAQKDRLCSESAENCRKTIRILEKAIDPNCQVTFNHRGWCGFPRLQSLDLLIAELILLIERARHLSCLAHSNGLRNFCASIEMDVVLRRNSVPSVFKLDNVLNFLETHFLCKFAVQEAKKKNEKPPQCYTALIDNKSVVIVLDFSYGLHPL